MSLLHSTKETPGTFETTGITPVVLIENAHCVGFYDTRWKSTALKRTQIGSLSCGKEQCCISCWSTQNEKKNVKKKSRCPSKWCESSAKAGESNCIDPTTIEIIIREARGETSVRGGNVERRRSNMAAAAGDSSLATTFAVKHADM